MPTQALTGDPAETKTNIKPHLARSCLNFYKFSINNKFRGHWIITRS